MRVEISFSIRGDARKVQRSTMRAYILKELRRRDNVLFSEILGWKGKAFPLSISWKERPFDAHDGHSVIFWISVGVSEAHDLPSAFKLCLMIKEVIERGLGKEAMKHKDTISKILKEYNGGGKRK